MHLFPELLLWIDPEARLGPHNMAVDEWLWRSAQQPVLRVYGWHGPWLSLGCFVPHAVASSRALADGVGLVRRLTGGGIVDHRGDWTYSLMVPTPWLRGLGRPRESYQRIHAALARALAEERVISGLADPPPGDSRAAHGACFENPVAGDLLGPDGAKQAGAAQRRSKRGLLHQGSVRVPSGASAREDRARRFAECLAESVKPLDLRIDHDAVAGLVATRYGTEAWLERF
jgi:lipoate-protein ligase A